MAKKKDENKKLPAVAGEQNEYEKYEKLVNQCIEIIKTNEILFISDLISYLPISKATFYNYKLDKLDALKEAINDQRIFVKQGIRKALVKTNTPAGLAMVYKMIATPEERAAINSYHEPKPSSEEAESTPIKDLFESLRRSRLQ